MPECVNEDSRPEVSLKILPGRIGLRLSLVSSKNRERKDVSDFEAVERGIDERHGARSIRAEHVERHEHAGVRVDHPISYQAAISRSASTMLGIALSP